MTTGNYVMLWIGLILLLVIAIHALYSYLNQEYLWKLRSVIPDLERTSEIMVKARTEQRARHLAWMKVKSGKCKVSIPAGSYMERKLVRAWRIE